MASENSSYNSNYTGNQVDKAVSYSACAYANSSYSTALGVYASANGSYSTALGRCANANAYAVAVGDAVNASTNAVAVGRNANANDSAVAVGYNANANTYAVAVGYNANANTCSVAVGYAARANSYAVAVGNNANANCYAVAVGDAANANCYAVAVGGSANANRYAVAVGGSANANRYAVAVGYSANATSAQCTIELRATTSTAYYCNTANYVVIHTGTTLTWNGLTSSWSISSDRRDKFDIRPIANAVALIRDLRPVSFRWNQRSLYRYDNARNPDHGIYRSDYDYNRQQTGEKAAPTRSLGFIAQELEEALEKHTGDKQYGGITSNSFVPDPHMTDEEKANFNAKVAKLEADGVESELSATMGEFMPIVVQAIKELDERVTALEEARA